MIFLKLVKNVAVFLGTKFYKVRYHHTEKIPYNQGYLICCNHCSNWDPVLLYKPIKTKLYFMAKQELFKLWPLSFCLKKLGAIPVKRGTRDMSAINKTIDLIAKKNAVVIFPEGTRSKTGEFLRPKSGAAMVAYKTNANILPVRIIYRNFKKFRSEVDVIYGDLITPRQLGLGENSLQIVSKKQNKIDDSKDIKTDNLDTNNYNINLRAIKNASLLLMDEIKKLNVD